MGCKSINDLVQIAIHDLIQIVDGQANAVIRAAVLREIVGADLFAPVTSAHLPLTVRIDGILLLFLFLRQQPAAENFEGLILVLELAPFVLTFYYHTSRKMCHTDGTGGFVDMLSACA